MPKREQASKESGDVAERDRRQSEKKSKNQEVRTGEKSHIAQ